MRVILLERVERLGQMGDVVQVRNGYARNFLIPQRKATRATPETIARFESERADIEARNLERRQEAEQTAEKVAGRRIIVIRSASEVGNLYGSVSPRDISEACSQEGIHVDRKQISLSAALKTLGVHRVPIVLHPEVVTHLELILARSEEEAQLQCEELDRPSPSSSDAEKAGHAEAAAPLPEGPALAGEEESVGEGKNDPVPTERGDPVPAEGEESEPR